MKNQEYMKKILSEMSGNKTFEYEPQLGCFPKDEEKPEKICYGQDIVLYYEENGKYGENCSIDESLESQDKFETFQNNFPLWSIKDWNCIPLLDKKEIPPFYDHPETFEIIDKNIKYDEMSGILEQDDNDIYTHSVLCFHPYNTKYNSINELRTQLVEWAEKYPDITKVSIIENGSWYNKNCDLVIIEQKSQHPSVTIYNYYDPVGTFVY